MSVADLAAHCEHNLSPSSFERILAQDTVLVAQTADQLIGFIQFGRANSAGESLANPDQEVRRLYVQAEFQNTRVGTLLLQTALEQPALRAAGRVFLDVWEHNHGARRFYERFGFQVIGAQPFLVQSGSPTSRDLIMVRRCAQ